MCCVVVVARQIVPCRINMLKQLHLVRLVHMLLFPWRGSDGLWYTYWTLRENVNKQIKPKQVSRSKPTKWKMNSTLFFFSPPSSPMLRVGKIIRQNKKERNWDKNKKLSCTEMPKTMTQLGEKQNEMDNRVHLSACPRRCIETITRRERNGRNSLENQELYDK